MALPRFVTGTIGGAAKGLGGIYDTLTPGSGSSRLSDRGMDIINPDTDAYGQNVRYKGNDLRTLGPSGSGFNAPIQGQTKKASTSASDPNAIAAYNNLMGSLNTRRQDIQGSASDWAKNYGLGLGQNISDYINTLRQDQQGIDEKGVQTELALKQAREGILGMVSRGIRSGGVMLANRNASDSSASAALANAYGEIGRGQLSDAGNQYEIENRNLGLQQANFDVQAQAGANRLKTQETQDIASAVADAGDKLSALDAWAADRSLPERIQVEKEKARIQAQIQSALGKYNEQLSSGMGGIRPASVEQRRGTAAGLANAGTAATNPFDFMSQAPAGFQGGPVSGNLPLFLAPRRREA
jgi:hypothetical protein